MHKLKLGNHELTSHVDVYSKNVYESACINFGSTCKKSKRTSFVGQPVKFGSTCKNVGSYRSTHKTRPTCNLDGQSVISHRLTCGSAIGIGQPI